jgi:hypothetical protein
MRHTSTLNLAEERKKDIIKKVNDKTNTQYTYILPWKPKLGKPTFLECCSLLLSYSFRIKGYMSNLGPHLRHNQNHTLLLTQEQSCSQFVLHLHDQQPLRLQTLGLHAFFIGFTLGKTINKRHPKMITYPHKSLATNTMNIGILLQSTTKWDYQSTTSQPSFGLQSVATRSLSTCFHLTSSTCFQSLYRVEPP